MKEQLLGMLFAFIYVASMASMVYGIARQKTKIILVGVVLMCIFAVCFAAIPSGDPL